MDGDDNAQVAEVHPPQGAQLGRAVRRSIYICYEWRLSEISKRTGKPLLTSVQSAGVWPVQSVSVLLSDFLCQKPAALSSDCVRTVCRDSRSLAKCPSSAELMQGTVLQCTHAAFTSYQTVDSLIFSDAYLKSDPCARQSDTYSIQPSLALWI